MLIMNFIKEKTVIKNGARLTVDGDLVVRGALTCEDGPLNILVTGNLDVQNRLECNRPDSVTDANAISIIVPCHRVIGSDGNLTGYAGGLTAKRKLLQLEGMNFGEQLELF